jgi:release factor glutamine methyltransferase
LREGDLRFEPSAALKGGADGLSADSRGVARAPAYLAAEGMLIEHGYDQAERVQSLLQRWLGGVESRRDLAGILRVTIGRMA